MSTPTSMQEAIQCYLEDRRRLGFGMTQAASDLARFARYAESQGHLWPLTEKLILGWAHQHVPRASDVTAARRLEIVQPFAEYCRQFELDTEFPPRGCLGLAHRRLAPHIYTDDELVEMLNAADRLMPKWPLRPQAHRALFGLISAAGLRPSEALNLVLSDVDLHAGALVVRNTKFNKSRCLPLHASTVRELGLYRQERDRHYGIDPGSPFFVSKGGEHLQLNTLDHVFRALGKRLGWRARGDYPYPRLYDLRHTFAVRRVQRWRESGQSIDHATFWLCTYLGHARISHTYWYLSGIPELMNIIGDRFESFVGFGSEGVSQ
ncbi:tyrosine-type recombinase/integrase [Ralstonia pseudosolanacearum]|uniref:tyrosine-type recombinase/integrase n=1 Tax=Ralstonia pseudosolanacearum TaxID=1310165 RepID=UPI0018A56EC6|nr:tyrosine-type recombinase/integrase [Ralstonia pseudosolanacearum]BCL94264.1 integrase [Ralstonia solanacearum]BCN06830.1 integrase [Ralstonia solanacearum]